MSANPATDERSRILLSFAMDNHGAAFAYWLRDRLMKTYGWYARNAVYMDCVASRGLHTKHAGTMDDFGKTKLEGWTYVAPDTRDKFKSQGYMPIGALNPLWNQMYEAAMAEAAAMIMVVTPEYLSSEWCLLEWTQFQQENGRRTARRQPRLKGVALNFIGDRGFATKAVKPINVDGVTVLPVTKAFGLGGLLWHREDYGIGESDYLKLREELGAIV